MVHGHTELQAHRPAEDARPARGATPRRLLLVLVAAISLGACSDVDRATNDGKDQIEENLVGLEESEFYAWTSPDAETELVASPVEAGGTGFRRYDVTSTGGAPDLRYVFRATGSANLFLDEETIAVGVCVSVRGPAGEVPTIEQIACPESELDRPEQPIEVEPEVIDEARPIRCPDGAENEGCD